MHKVGLTVDFYKLTVWSRIKMKPDKPEFEILQISGTGFGNPEQQGD